MTDRDRVTPGTGQCDGPVKFTAQRRDGRIGIQEDVPAGARYRHLAGDRQRDAFFRRVAVDEEQRAVVTDCLHEPLHVSRVAGQEASLVIVDPCDVRQRREVLFDALGKLLASRVQPDAELGTIRFGLRLTHGLQRQMQQDLLAIRVGEFRDRPPARRLRQYRAGNRPRQRCNTLAVAERIAEIVDDDREFRRTGLQRRGEQGNGGKAGCRASSSHGALLCMR